MSNVKEYLELQLPYLRRMKRAADKLVEEKEGPIDGLDSYIDFIVSVLPDIHGLIITYHTFITGQQQIQEETGFWGADIEFINKEDLLTLPEHEPRKVAFGEN